VTTDTFRRPVLISMLAIVATAACHRSAPSDQPSEAPAEQTVFTDSLLHAERCAPIKPGEDWRRVCTPLDQSAPRPIKP
jgi:hypothetical protein